MSFAYNDALDDNTTAATEPSSDTGTAVLERPKAQERRADEAQPEGLPDLPGVQAHIRGDDEVIHRRQLSVTG